MKVSDLIDLPPDVDSMAGLEAVAERDPVVWSMINRRVKGEPLVYDNSRKLSDASLGAIKQVLIQSDYEDELYSRLLHHRPFHRQPLRDQHKHKVFEKSRQVGVTELGATEVFHFLATHPNTKWVTCVPDDAEILTRRGWMTRERLRDDDETLTLDKETHISTWQPLLEVQVFDYSGFLLPVGPHPFHCTAEHRWPVLEKVREAGKRVFRKNVVEAKDLKQHHMLVRMAPHDFEWGKTCSSVLSPRHAALLGWVVSDGHCWMTGTAPNLNTPMMEIMQNARKHLVEIEELTGVSRSPSNAHTEKPTIAIGKHGGRIVGYHEGDGPFIKNKHDKNGGHHLKEIYGDNYRVRLKREDVDTIWDAGYRVKADLLWIVNRLSEEAAEAMWDALVKAEGNTSGRDRKSTHFTQNHGPVLDAFQILCTLLGKAANINPRGAYVIDPKSRSARMRAVYPKRPDSDYRHYVGKVWCPRTKNGTWFMRYRGKVVFTHNTFPRNHQLIDFSNTRAATAFAETSRMAALAGSPNQVFTRRVGDSYWLFRSAWESNLGEGIDADGATLDEKDRMRDKVEFAFKESLKSSKHRLFREFSTPTMPNAGIDIPFRASDQQVWLVKCKKCGLEQEVTHLENIIQVKSFPLGTKELPPESYDFLCRKQSCRGELDRVFSGRWVPKFPDRKLIRGYHVTQLIAPWISATRVMQDKIDMRFREIWLNYVCGVPAAGDMEMLSDADFVRACSGHALMTGRPSRGWSQVSVGIDWGQLNWVVVMGRNAVNQRPYVIGIAVFEDTTRELESAEMVYKYFMAFSPEIVIADAGYGKDRNSFLLRKLCPIGDEGRFWAQLYNSSIKHGKTFVPEWSDESRARVTVDRTITLKNICRAIREPEFGLPALDLPEMELFTRHLKSLAPFREIDDETKELVETIKSSGDDHLAHACASALLGMEKLGKTSKFGVSFE